MLRRIAVVVLVVLGLLVGIVGNLSSWTWWLLADKGNFVDTVAPVSNDPAVAEAISRELTTNIFTTYDVDDKINDALPGRLDFIGPFISEGAEQFVENALRQIVASEQFESLWRRALETSHDQAIGILRDEHDVLGTTGGQVSLDLKQVLVELDERLEGRGIDLYDPTDLPEELGRIDLVQSGQLRRAQDAVELFDRVQLWAPIFVFALLGAAVALARNRRKTLQRIGVAAAAVFLLELVAMRLARNWLLDKVNVENQDAFEAVWNRLLHQLRVGLWALVAAGIVVALAAALMAPQGRAARVRAFVTKRVHDLREGTLSEETQDTLGRALAPWKRVIQFSMVLAVLLILVVLPTVRPRAVILAALLLVVLLGLVEFVAGRSLPAAKEDVDAPTS